MRTKEEIAQYKKEWAEKNKERLKERMSNYYLENKEKLIKNNNENYYKNKDLILKKQKLYREKNEEIIRKRENDYKSKNVEKIGAYHWEYNKWKNRGTEKEFSKYYKENRSIIEKEYRIYIEGLVVLSDEERIEKRKEYVKKYNKAYRENRKSNDFLYKLTNEIRCIVASSIKRMGYAKTSKTQEILGCSFDEFKTHIESKFEPWMNWDNYGNWNGYPKEINVAWDIDHIIPVSSAKTQEEIIKLNHYSNLQPLCSYTNRHIKSNSIDFGEDNANI